MRTSGWGAGFVRGQTDLLAVLGRQIVVEGEILRQPAVRLVRRAKPDDGEKRLARLFRGLDEANGFVHEHLGAFARKDLRGLAVARKGRIQLEEIVVRHPLVKSHRAGVEGRTGLDRANMPFAEMAATVAGPAQNVSDRDLLRPHRPAGSERAHPVGMPSGKKAGARRRTTRMAGIKCVKPQPGGGHFIEYGRLDVRMAVVAGLLPAVIVAHQQDDVGELFGRECVAARDRQQRDKSEDRFHGCLVMIA